MIDSSPTIPINFIKDLKIAASVTVLTGAGISAESGIPTFREAQTGLWSRYNPEELATRQAFRDNPNLVWSWYRWRRLLIADSKPNPGHKALVELEGFFIKRGREFNLITQNVDGLHKQAGSRTIVELHGNIFRNKCFNCNKIAESEIPVSTAEIPHCDECSGLLRPDVVWFGENLSHYVLDKARRAARNCGIFLSAGTSGIVQPAASLQVIALQNNAVVAEINPETTPLTPLAAYSIHGEAGNILPRLLKAIENEIS
jgi:NAD-dependent deacetylase